MRKKKNRYLLIRKVVALCLTMAMLLGVWTSVSNAADPAVETTEENTQESVASEENIEIETDQKEQTEGYYVEEQTESEANHNPSDSEQGQGTEPIDFTDTTEEMEKVTEESHSEEFIDISTAPKMFQVARSESAAPLHRKYIEYNGDDSYTLTLDVTGKYDSTITKRPVDVILVIDRSNSMVKSMGNFDWRTRLKVLQEVVTGQNGLSDAIFNNEQIDARMSVVTYYGGKGNNDRAYNDAACIREWTNSKTAVDRAVNAINISGNEQDGGTNCEAGLRTGGEVLLGARQTAQKIMIFLSDGQPTYRYNASGKTEGSGTDDWGGYNAANAYAQAKKISGLDQFYTIGFTSDAQNTFLQNLATKPTGTTIAQFYSAADADELANIFRQIAGNITEYTCRNVIITDTLSEYAQIPDITQFHPVITAETSDGRSVDLSGVNIQVVYDDATRTITATFPTGYTLERDVTYSIRFNIIPTQKAYDEYAENGSNYGETRGSENSDAPDNDTSSGKPGFYTNTQATLTYTYGKDDAQPQCVDYQQKPVLQVDSMTIFVEKVWQNVGTSEKPEVKVELYRDAETLPREVITLNPENEWKGTFPNQAKGNHRYMVKEQVPEGYVSAVTGDVENGFVITNTKLPSLFIEKQVKGEMADKTKEFNFVINLKGASGNAVNGTYSYTGNKNGTITFENGRAEIALAHNQKIEIHSLPLGATYMITEQQSEMDRYLVTYNGISSDKAEGILREDATITVVNTKELIPVTAVTDGEISFLPGILIAVVSLFVLGSISQLIYGKKQKSRK